MKYKKDFYINDTFEVAKNLLGSLLYTNINDEIVSGKIVELEIYLGVIDKASHAYGGRRTKRTEAQFLTGGIAYIFLVYGIHSQFCVVTAGENVPHAILIRALEPKTNIEIMKKRRGTNDILNLTSGPGKLCKALQITREQNKTDLTGNSIWIEHSEIKIPETDIIYARRIGIDYAEEYKDKLWRLYIKDNPHVSKIVPPSHLGKNREKTF
jgi:DNA-3-methyladenine glycosylase